MGNKDRKKDRRRSRLRERHKKRREKKSRRSSSDSISSDGSRERHRKDRRRRRSRSSSSDPKHMTAEEIARLTEERRKEKQLAKELETVEEKRARRLAKKAAKERKRKEEMGWDDEMLSFDNKDNPYGDDHLTETFVWAKKVEKEGKKHLDHEQLEQLQKRKVVENKMELEKVKKRRRERELEMEARDKDREIQQREKEADYYRAWERQEDSFHLNQAKLRSTIRIEDGRAKPIDLLAQYINSKDDDQLNVEMHEPYTYLNNLTITDLEDLQEDIRVYGEMEGGESQDYWRDVTIIVEEEITKLRKIDPSSRTYVRDRRSGLNQAVGSDVTAIFKGKSLAQLELLKHSIVSKLEGRGEGIDVGYWESLLGQLKAHMARTRLREFHQQMLRRKLFRLKQQQGIEGGSPLFPIVKQRDSPVPQLKGEVKKEEPDDDKPLLTEDDLEDAAEEEEDAVIEETDENRKEIVSYESGRYSPTLLRHEDLEITDLVHRVEEDIKRLDHARAHVMNTGKAKEDKDLELLKKAQEGMDDEEAQFSVQIPLDKQTLAWSDKYRPRKPRFFNRVHTGFEWNKYNQTHYDVDNPPPKIVQGYKFNIFYPDLINKVKPPEYALYPLEEEADFAMLKFRAGPPYEDIAFKVVNREWECSYKRGFRCQFHNNIFQLWFHFKRYRYRSVKEADYYRAWERQEDSFHLNQAKLRSTIRIEDGRAKPIDLLAQYINSKDDDQLNVEMHEPYTYLNNLTITDLEDLQEDIRVYGEMEGGESQDYWRDVTIIVEEEITKLRKIDPSSRTYVRDRRSGLNQAVGSDVTAIFKGKSLAQLELLKHSIVSKLEGRGEGIDVGYWESLLGQLKAHMARTRLREFHQQMLRRKLFRLKQQQGIEGGSPLFPIVKQRDSPVPQLKGEVKKEEPDDDKPLLTEDDLEDAAEEEEDAVIEETDENRKEIVSYESGRYSPTLLRHEDLEITDLVHRVEEDIKRLDHARAHVMNTGKAKEDKDLELLKKAQEGMDDEEAQFSVQIPLDKQTLAWSDKYRPRKPRFFNRVHTGFEWNKYNQTHYDVDNPPPKIVQGYKFNIFYPDLINKVKPPEYALYPLEEEADFAMLKFRAGPPYEDIAFKVVNREWECSYKRGFRCQFHNNIFQLWFHFKRYRYRR